MTLKFTSSVTHLSEAQQQPGPVAAVRDMAAENRYDRAVFGVNHKSDHLILSVNSRASNLIIAKNKVTTNIHVVP